MRSVFVKTMRDHRRGLVGWSIGISAMVVAMVAVWPSVRDMPGLDEFAAGYPEILRELFNLEELTTPAGYLNAELFSFMLPILFLVFAIGRGARSVAGEDEEGTLDVLLAMPHTRTRVLVEKVLALWTSIALLGVVTFTAIASAAAVARMDIPVGDLAAACVQLVLIGTVFGSVAFGVGAAVGRRGVALAWGASLAAGTYVLYALAELVTVLRPWRFLSPFEQTLGEGAVGAGWRPSYAWPLVASIAIVTLSRMRFEARDLRA